MQEISDRIWGKEQWETLDLKSDIFSAMRYTELNLLEDEII